jgi:hypothetical protein
MNPHLNGAKLAGVAVAMAYGGSVELVEGKDYTVDREAGILEIAPFKIDGVYHHADGAQRIAAAEARRARRNAKRAAAAAKVGG